MAVPLIPLALSVLPSLAGWAFGKNAEGVAKSVAQAAVSIFGTDEPEAIEKAIAANPELAWKFKDKLLAIKDKEADRAHAERMAEFKNTDGARDLYVKVGGMTVPILAVTTVVLFFVSNGAMLYGLHALMTKGIDIKNVELAIAAAGLVGNIQGFINSKTDIGYNFFFGSSVSARSNAQATQAAMADIAKSATKKG